MDPRGRARAAAVLPRCRSGALHPGLPCNPARSAADLARPPSWGEVTPLLRNGLFLSTRSLLAMGGCRV